MHSVKFKYKIGDPVRVKEINVKGLIDGLLYDSGGPQYRVIYWHDGARHGSWVYDWEIEPRKVQPQEAAGLKGGAK